MMDSLIALSTEHYIITYITVILICIVEGPVISMVFGALVKLGYFPLIPVFVVLMFGDLIGDVMWYAIGRFYGNKFIQKYGKYFSIDDESVRKVSEIFVKYQHRILLISKMTNGFGFSLVTLITAGIVKIPFKKYFLINFIGQIVWTGILISVGYFFGKVYEQVDSILGKMTVVASFIIIVMLFFGYMNYMKKRANNIKHL